MANLTDKIENALNETRILVLGIQILIGFGFRSFFEPGFDKMAIPERHLQLAALGLMLAGLGLLLLPVPYHRLVLHGRDTTGLHRVLTATVSAGLLPFALSMGISFYLGARWLAGALASAIAAGIVLILALYFWYGLELISRRRKQGKMHLGAVFDPLQEIDMNEQEYHSHHAAEAGVDRMPRRAAGRAGPAGLSAHHHVDDGLRQDSASLEAVAPGEPGLDCRVHHSADRTRSLPSHRQPRRRQRRAAQLYFARAALGDGISRAGGLRRFLHCLPGDWTQQRREHRPRLALLLCFFGSWFGFAMWQARRIRHPPCHTTKYRAGLLPRQSPMYRKRTCVHPRQCRFCTPGRSWWRQVVPCEISASAH